jgi:hypothetical protein
VYRIAEAGYILTFVHSSTALSFVKNVACLRGNAYQDPVGWLVGWLVGTLIMIPWGSKHV